MFEFIGGLAESRLFPARKNLERIEPEHLADLTVLMFCSLRLLLTEHDSELRQWARHYCRNAIQYGDWKAWRTSGNDLYVAIHALMDKHETLRNDDLGFRDRVTIQTNLVKQWLHDVSNHVVPETLTRRLFTRLDTMLRISDPVIRSIRRRAMDWPELSNHEKHMLMEQILVKLRRYAEHAEVLPYLTRMARKHGWEVGKVEQKQSGLLKAFENASCGATSAASVAAVPGGIGAGFDPDQTWRSIYGNTPKAPRKAKKPVVIRRPPPEGVQE